LKGGEGVWRANKALISLQQAAVTRKSDFPEECLDNFANACGILGKLKATEQINLSSAFTHIHLNGLKQFFKKQKTTFEVFCLNFTRLCFRTGQSFRREVNKDVPQRQFS